MAAKGQKPFINPSDKTSNGLDLYLDQTEMHTYCKLLGSKKGNFLLKQWVIFNDIILVFGREPSQPFSQTPKYMEKLL